MSYEEAGRIEHVGKRIIVGYDSRRIVVTIEKDVYMKRGVARREEFFEFEPIEYSNFKQMLENAKSFMLQQDLKKKESR